MHSQVASTSTQRPTVMNQKHWFVCMPFTDKSVSGQKKGSFKPGKVNKYEILKKTPITLGWVGPCMENS